MEKVLSDDESGHWLFTIPPNSNPVRILGKHVLQMLPSAGIFESLLWPTATVDGWDFFG